MIGVHVIITRGYYKGLTGDVVALPREDTCYHTVRLDRPAGGRRNVLLTEDEFKASKKGLLKQYFQ